MPMLAPLPTPCPKLGLRYAAPPPAKRVPTPFTAPNTPTLRSSSKNPMRYFPRHYYSITRTAMYVRGVLLLHAEEEDVCGEGMGEKEVGEEDVKMLQARSVKG
ncbi:hypothetical protein K439DRAFT_1615408 [Ramaria rubella]|nr:hypothetical protein K439DRAFT_1615408 [Ramaria rubella]